jgi:hypothetical protein
VTTIFRAADLPKTRDISREILARREPEIVDGCLDGTNWFLAIVEQAATINSRAAAWAARTEKAA